MHVDVWVEVEKVEEKRWKRKKKVEEVSSPRALIGLKEHHGYTLTNN